MDVYVKGKRIRLQSRSVIGSGGEAEVYRINQNQVLKLFKSPQHPDFQSNPMAQQAAFDRLLDHQQKLPQFPPNLPATIVQPQSLVTDKNGQQILGYTMPYLTDVEVLFKWGDRSCRQRGISPQQVVQLFLSLHDSIVQLHQTSVVIGDFNDLNVLVKATTAYLIDADSFQYGRFLCSMFTATFVDPLLCDPTADRLQLQQPHNPNSDWYAFTVMLMQCLLFVSPYGGIYRPSYSSQKTSPQQRPLQRITVFHPQVRYPKPALPYGRLPDQLLHYFQQVFEHDRRGVFPRSLLETLTWTTCTQCGQDHARPTCPDCTQPSPTTQVTVSRGSVIATRVFQTRGIILTATLTGNKLQWLYHDQNSFRREDGSIVLSGELQPQLQFHLCPTTTIAAKPGEIVLLKPGYPAQAIRAETVASNGDRYVWTTKGQLLRQGSLGPEPIGEVLENQTRVWLGPQFGFGFYHAEELRVAFVFDLRRSGINDRVKLPRFNGQLIDAICHFGSDRCWLLLAIQRQAQRVHTCTVFDSAGQMLATAEAIPGDGSWLGSLQGKGAAGNFLFAATDEGLVRVELANSNLQLTKTFPDTEPFVDSHCQIFASPAGLYVVHQQEIHLLKLI